MKNRIEHHGENYELGRHGLLTGRVFNAEGVTIGYHPELKDMPPETLRNRCQTEAPPCAQCR